MSTQKWRPLFNDFLSHLQIDSKETNVGPLIPWGTQIKFMDELCAGLDEGIRDFSCLKGRQYGITTIVIAIDIFWLMVFEGTQGALVTDDEGNRDKFRVLIDRYIASLPRGMRVGTSRHNRGGLVLNNGSSLDYLIAGKKKTNATLGQSRALNFLHATEIGSYGSEEGFASLVSSLARTNPNRLYIKESTAHGMNLWQDLWTKARKDKLNKRCFFIGWYLQPHYQFKRGTKQFKKYAGPCDETEQTTSDEVMERYGVRITEEQWAWHRYMRTEEIPSEDLMAQNFPFTEDEAFIRTGNSFFSLPRVTENIKFLRETTPPLKAYRYTMGDNFLATQIEPLSSTAEADLRIYEEPVPGGVYVMGVDSAYGRSDDSDNSCISLWRCFADRIVQAAEYATNEPETYQVAWVMAHLAGAYKNVWINLEINGPGSGIMTELRHLKQLLDNGYLRAQASGAGLLDVFSSVRWYLYHRPDSMSAGYVYNWKTTQDNKLAILNQMRDNFLLRLMTIWSIPLLEEMSHMEQQGGEINASGRNHDDRVFAAALANRAYIDWVRAGLIANAQTYDKVMEGERMQREAPQSTLIGRAVSEFFQQQAERRMERADSAAWQGDDDDF